MSAERDELGAAAEGMLVLLCGRIVDAPGRENDPRIVDLARSAVDEQNKNAVILDILLPSCQYRSTQKLYMYPSGAYTYISV